MKLFFGCLALLFLVIGINAFFSWIVMLLWNWLIPDLFNGPSLTFWQAWAGMILLSLLTYGFRRIEKTK